MLLYQVATSKAHASARWMGWLGGRGVPLTLVRTPGPSVIFLNGDIISQAESVSFRLVGLDSWIFFNPSGTMRIGLPSRTGLCQRNVGLLETDAKGWLRKSETLKILPPYIYLIAFIMKRAIHAYWEYSWPQLDGTETVPASVWHTSFQSFCLLFYLFIRSLWSYRFKCIRMLGLCIYQTRHLKQWWGSHRAPSPPGVDVWMCCFW